MPIAETLKEPIMKTLIEAVRDVDNLDANSAIIGVWASLAAFDANTLPKLRALRLWHWRKALGTRKACRVAIRRADAAKDAGNDRLHMRLMGSARLLDSEANGHISAVQTLNEFFNVGDTAEKDAKNV